MLRKLKLLVYRMWTFFMSFFSHSHELAWRCLCSEDCKRAQLEEIIHRERKKYTPERFQRRMQEYYAIHDCFCDDEGEE